MPGTVQDLTNTLLTSVDSEGNVQDMAIVMNVVCALENIIVTAEDLKVTRLGKFINLIRRKVVDKQLAKRLKNLVKQWQQLLQTMLPNGATSTNIAPAIGTAGTKGSQKAERASPIPPTRLASQVVSPHLPSSSLPSVCALENSIIPRPDKVSHSSSSGSYTSTLVPSMSDSSQEVNSSGYYSLNPHSSSPTPPSSPSRSSPSHSSQSPIPPTPVNRTKNRIQVMHMMSSIRTLSPSPSKDPLAQSNLTRSTSLEYHHHHPVANIVPSPSAEKRHQSSPSPPSSSNADIEICVTMDTSNGISNKSSLSLPSSQCIPGEAEVCWTEFAALQGLVEGTELNGSRDKNSWDVEKFSRKRPRSYSPLSLHSSTPSPRHKMHKPHRHRSMLDKHKEFIVHLPLDKVSLKALLPSPETMTAQGHDVQDIRHGPSCHIEEPEHLVVRYQLSMLSRIPRAQAETRETSFQTANSSLTLHHPQSLFLPPPPPTSIAHSKNNNHADTDSSKDAQSRLMLPSSHPRPSSEARENRQHSTCIFCQSPRDVPPDVCPGIHGCMGRDGHWYGWTDHIHSCGLEVTILPYVYIDF